MFLKALPTFKLTFFPCSPAFALMLYGPTYFTSVVSFCCCSNSQNLFFQNKGRSWEEDKEGGKILKLSGLEMFRAINRSLDYSRV